MPTAAARLVGSAPVRGTTPWCVNGHVSFARPVMSCSLRPGTPLWVKGARLDIVELAGPHGGAGAYDVSVATPLRDDPGFVRACAVSPGHAAALRHDEKLSSQYAHRVVGSRLTPLVVETGGRWHSSVPGLARALARDLVTRLPGFATEDMGTVVAWWGARLSAILLRGNARAYEALGCPAGPAGDVADHMPRGPLPHGVPEGGSVYELLVPPGAW